MRALRPTQAATTDQIQQRVRAMRRCFLRGSEVADIMGKGGGRREMTGGPRGVFMCGTHMIRTCLFLHHAALKKKCDHQGPERVERASLVLVSVASVLPMSASLRIWKYRWCPRPVIPRVIQIQMSRHDWCYSVGFTCRRQATIPRIPSSLRLVYRTAVTCFLPRCGTGDQRPGDGD